jgi:hypothetical protein
MGWTAGPSTAPPTTRNNLVFDSKTQDAPNVLQAIETRVNSALTFTN